MPVFLSTSCFRNTALKENIPLIAYPEFIRSMGLDGVEISDRDIAPFGPSSNTLDELSRESIRNECGIILDINADLTLGDDKALSQEILHVDTMMHAARKIGAALCRISLGGQTFSVHKIMRFFHPGRKTVGSQSASPEEGDRIDNGRQRQSRHRSPIVIWMKRRLLYMAHHARCSMGSNVKDADRKINRAASALKTLVVAADELDLRLGIENHWGIAAKPEHISQVLEILSSPNLGVCLDLGNFPRDVDPEEAVRRLGPRAFIVHVKCFGQNKNQRMIGNYQRYFKILEGCGYQGPVTIEYEGLGNDLRACLNLADSIKCFAFFLRTYGGTIH